VGHAITLTDPLRVKSINRNGAFFGYAVKGTPADCVKLAINELMKPPPDLVVSGINLGANVGINVIYSGTVSAATEGTILGVPAIAVSINTFRDPDFRPAARFARLLVRQVKEHGLPPYTSLNVNVPAISESKIRGVRVTRQGVTRFVEKFDRRIDPRENVYYWQCGSNPPLEEDGDTDGSALANDCISITPIQHDLTNYDFLESLRKAQRIPVLDFHLLISHREHRVCPERLGLSSSTGLAEAVRTRIASESCLTFCNNE
jgi:5'-nucleotidase